MTISGIHFALDKKAILRAFVIIKAEPRRATRRVKIKKIKRFFLPKRPKLRKVKSKTLFIKTFLIAQKYLFATSAILDGKCKVAMDFECNAKLDYLDEMQRRQSPFGLKLKLEIYRNYGIKKELLGVEK